MKIQLSDHFTYQKLLRFVFPTIIMMIFTSIYGVIDGLFVSNFVGKTPFAAISFLRALVFQALSVIILPLFLGVDGVWLAVTAAELCACIISIGLLAAKRKTYHY